MAGNPIKFSDLFEDDGAIDKLLKGIELIESKYKGLGSTVVAQIKKMRKEIESLIITDEV